MIVRAGLLALVLTLAVPAAASAVVRPFETPGGQVYCAYMRSDGVPAQIRCQATFLSEGMTGVLKVKGRVRFRRIFDSVADPGAEVLAYGKTRRFGPLSCKCTRKAGMRCKSRRSGKGFFLGRKRQGVF